jgi:hypothetical protein
MTATAIEAGVPLGPGSLHIGLTGTLLDISCNINNATVAANKNQDDSVTKLCGTVVPGAVSYDYTLSGNVDTDIAESTGFFALTQAQAGKLLDFEFIPNTDAGTSAAGTLIVDPLDFGGDETTQTMASDFEFAIIGVPTYTYGGAAGTQSAAAEPEPESVPA